MMGQGVSNTLSAPSQFMMERVAGSTGMMTSVAADQGRRLQRSHVGCHGGAWRSSVFQPAASSSSQGIAYLPKLFQTKGINSHEAGQANFRSGSWARPIQSAVVIVRIDLEQGE